MQFMCRQVNQTLSCVKEYLKRGMLFSARTLSVFQSAVTNTRVSHIYHDPAARSHHTNANASIVIMEGKIKDVVGLSSQKKRQRLDLHPTFGDLGVLLVL